jgi:hypothetical protein
MPTQAQLVRQSRTVLAASRTRARDAKDLIERSRKQLSRSGNTVIAGASKIGAARWELSSTRRRLPSRA